MSNAPLRTPFIQKDLKDAEDFLLIPGEIGKRDGPRACWTRSDDEHCLFFRCPHCGWICSTGVQDIDRTKVSIVCQSFNAKTNGCGQHLWISFLPDWQTRDLVLQRGKH